MSIPQHFYDIHCHAFNLSHANLIAIIKRVFSKLARVSNKRYLLRIFMLIASIPASVILVIIFVAFSLFPAKVQKLGMKLLGFLGLNKVINLLSAMQNDLGNLFILMEKDVQTLISNNGHHFKIGDNTYHKIVLTPLMMDFGYKGIDCFPNTHYKVYGKPIVEQVTDLFDGIKKYRNNNPDGIFEIYPFLGLNTQNYPFDNETSDTMDNKPNLSKLPQYLKDKIDYFHPRFHFKGKMMQNEMDGLKSVFKGNVDKDRIQRIFDKSQNIGKISTLENLLDKYFKNFSPEKADDRYVKLKNKFLKMEAFDGNIETEGFGDYNFAGIKVYPPLGFNPWPERDAIELEKVKLLYSYCQEKSIPITTHCSKGGFRVIDEKATDWNNSPATWEKVLTKYPRLKLNIAHFGGELSGNKWQRKIVELILSGKYPHVYVDISYVCYKEESYASLEKMINKLCKSNDEVDTLKKKILFGTDFTICLLDIDSYQKYVKYFMDTNRFIHDKNQFCSANPHEFLFCPNG